MTVTEFKNKCEAAFFRGNPEVRGCSIEWLFVGDETPCHGAPGTCRSGRFRVTAEGYKSRVMHAYVDSEGVMVR